MFPFTPIRYIRTKLANIQANNPEAVARLKEELLRNPIPNSDDWNDTEDDEIEEDVEKWKDVKLSEMRCLFPDRCPDWLMDNLNNISVTAKGAGSKMFEEMEKQFTRKADEIFSLSEADRDKLPSLRAWKERRQLQDELEMWGVRITAQAMVGMFEDPASNFFGHDRKPETNLYRMHSLAGLREEFRYQNAQQIGAVFRRSRFFFAPARRALLLRGNTRKTRRPDKDVGYPAAPCLAFIRERRFCQMEEEIGREVQRRHLNREQMKTEAMAAGLLEECLICFASDCLPSDMISCKVLQDLRHHHR